MSSLIAQLSKPSKWPSPGSSTSSRMALELAMGIKSVKQVCDEYGLTVANMKALLQRDAQLRQQVGEYRQIWNHPMNARERVQIKAAVMAEDALMDIWQIMTNQETNPNTRLDAHRHLAKLADVEPQKDGGANDGGPRFSLVLNLGGGERVSIETARQVEDAPEDIPVEAAVG